MGVKNDIHSYTYNPAINLTQVEDAAKYSANKSTQTIVKTLLDFASGLAYKKRLKASNTEVKIVDKNSKPLDKLEQDALVPYVLNKSPTVYLTETEMLGEEKHLLEDIKIYKNKLTGYNGDNSTETAYTLTNLNSELDLRCSLNTTHTASINTVTQSQVNNENPILKLQS